MNPIDLLFAVGLEVAKATSEKYDDYDEDDYENESFSDKVTRYGVNGAAKLRDKIADECNKQQ